MRGTRHSDPYRVVYFEPIDPNITAPTYEDCLLILKETMKADFINDGLNRPPQLPLFIKKVRKICYYWMKKSKKNHKEKHKRDGWQKVIEE